MTAWRLMGRRPGSGDSEWSAADFVELAEVSDGGAFWGLMSLTEALSACLELYFFREGSLPAWDHASNVGGGCLSVRVPHEAAPGAWRAAAACAMSGLLGGRAGSAVNGVSISRKGAVCVVKAWTAGRLGALDAAGLPPPFDAGGLMFRCNSASMAGAASARCGGQGGRKDGRRR